MSEYEPMAVQRVADESGSHIEPPLDQSWDELTKLRWHAGVVEADCGVRAYIMPGALTTPGLFGSFRVHWNQYAIRIGNRSHSSFPFSEAWTFLNGVESGATEVRREAVLA